MDKTLSKRSWARGLRESHLWALARRRSTHMSSSPHLFKSGFFQPRLSSSALLCPPPLVRIQKQVCLWCTTPLFSLKVPAAVCCQPVGEPRLHTAGVQSKGVQRYSFRARLTDTASAKPTRYPSTRQLSWSIWKWRLFTDKCEIDRLFACALARWFAGRDDIRILRSCAVMLSSET